MTTTGLLPSYYSNRPVPFWKLCKSKAKFIVFLLVLTFCIVCFGTFFYLPDFRGSSGRIYDQIKQVGPELLIPPPPQLEDSQEALPIIRHEGEAKDDPHVIGDREKLKVRYISFLHLLLICLFPVNHCILRVVRWPTNP